MSNSPEGPVILAAFANDRTDQTHFLRNLSEEAQRIQAVFEPARELCPLVLLPSATLDEILNAFQKYRNRVVVFHYAGHANGFELLLESASGGVHRVGAQGLAAFLGQQQGLQLVFLNGCSTERQAEDLLNAGVGCVIATTQSIDDGVATEIASRFYNGIVNTAPLQAAYTQAVGSAQAASGGETQRLIRRKPTEEPVAHVEGRWPWLLKFRPGAERVAQWNLPDAAGDPLFGLPAVAQRALPKSPYRHLYRFEAEQAEVFFGRGSEIRDLYQRVTAPDSPPVILFYGPSGVGKSSLLDAGLVPRLSSQYDIRYVRRDPAMGLGETLRGLFPQELRGLSRRDAWVAAEQQSGRPLVIVLDQVEEVFTKPIAALPEELPEFTQLLSRIFSAADRRPQGRLILGFRKEWFAEIDELLAEAQVPRSRVFLERLSRDGAVEAIAGPVDDPRLQQQYGLTIENGLPDLIADDLLADPNTPVAPTLQILLTRMWSEACRVNPEKPRFDTELYQSLHRNGILLDDFLSQQMHQIQDRLPEAAHSGFLLDLLMFHTTEIGTSAEHSREGLTQNYSQQAQSGLLEQTLKLCEELYLLTFSGDQPHVPSRSSRLLHDTLAPLVRSRHEGSELPGQRARRIVDNRMLDWPALPKEGEPLDLADLKSVEAGVSGTRAWTTEEQRLIEASRRLRFRNRIWKRIFQGLGVAAVILIAITAGVAYWQRGVALHEKGVAEVEKGKAIQEQAKAQAELANSQRRLGVTARDSEQEFFKSAHHFAAAAAASTAPSEAAAMSFAAGRSAAGLKLVQLVYGPGFINEAWLLENGDVCAWNGGPGFPNSFRRWSATGELRSHSPLSQSVSRVLLSPTADRLVQVNGSQIAVCDVREGQVQPPVSDLQMTGGQTHTTRFADPILFWNAEGVFLIDPSHLSRQRMTEDQVDGARVSASQRKALTWKANEPAKLWTLRPSGNWEAIELPAQPGQTFDSALSPDFLGATEECLVWVSEIKPNHRGDNSQVVTGNVFHADGQLLTALHTGDDDEQLNQNQYKFQNWKAIETQVPAGVAVCLIGDQGYCTWQIPRGLMATELVPVALPTETPYFSGHVGGVSLGRYNSSIAVRVDKQLYVRGVEPLRTEGGYPPIMIPLDQVYGDAVFSEDGTKLLAWTSRERVTIGGFVSSVGNIPGSLRVWDTATGVPLTAPVKLSQGLRGAKFVSHDSGFLVWGEDGAVQHWDITGKPPMPRQYVDHSPVQNFTALTDQEWEKYNLEQVRLGQEMRAQAMDPQRVKGLTPLEAGQKFLEWGGHSGGPGQIPGGYACLGASSTRQLVTPFLRHQHMVSSAVCNADQSRILTATSLAPEDSGNSTTAHLWDTALATELIEPLSLQNGKLAEAWFEPGENSVHLQTHNGHDPHAWAVDLSPDPTLDAHDPRLEIVIRTGTRLNRYGELHHLPRAAWAELRDSRDARPTYEEWYEQLESAATSPARTLEPVTP